MAGDDPQETTAGENATDEAEQQHGQGGSPDPRPAAGAGLSFLQALRGFLTPVVDAGDRIRFGLAGERFPAALPWPRDVYQITGTVLLPPTATPRGPVTWVHPPRPTALRLCREIDILAAARAALSNPPSLSDPRGCGLSCNHGQSNVGAVV